MLSIWKLRFLDYLSLREDVIFDNSRLLFYGNTLYVQDLLIVLTTYIDC